MGRSETSSSDNELRRYTDLPSVLDTLLMKRLVLVSPKKWDDQNDSYFLRAYTERKRIPGVLALCLAEAAETYHHWKIFSGGSSGACIVLKKREFFDYLSSTPSVACGKVRYHSNSELKALRPLKTNDLPFYKRIAFKHEDEYRLVYDCMLDDQGTQDLDIQIDLIDRIVLNPWTARSVYQSVSTVIRRIEGCENLAITRSLLVNNETWQGHATDADAEDFPDLAAQDALHDPDALA